MNNEISKKLQLAVKNICDLLRTSMEVNDYRDFVLGFLFYKYLSETIENTVKKFQNIDYKDFQSSPNYDDEKEFIKIN
ncbi:type I restriction-modification system DNA methylase subunit [Mycoplasmoides fastidiosum]|uniref:Type I restriction-modification system DNA methylase subunit n=1 Tax=Mycoplasmoides fastidiosum TaxID=92758 RepID=A0ABU0M005_9BACT|nr:type I restriction-modification system subunit M N-terminal domain-containing protein [Mycoplasmoides fastidiosum]MDQ0514274.1 type I restriction-modification system DNA methylase subunit [Mycoplasmoides fastidiosum]UUD38121.1 type I restriction-modification system subunit M N-terminal domain-containing protein [Mycoplasmoides fastidiosum]